MGAAYAPLRPEFRNVEYPVREQAEAVLLTTGGSDRYDLAGQILRAVPKELAVVFHVVSGIFNPHYDALCRMALADDKKRSAQPASEGRPAKDLQPTKKHPQRHCP